MKNQKQGPANFTGNEPEVVRTDERFVVFGDKKIYLNTPIFVGKFNMEEAIQVPTDKIFWVS